MFINVSVLIYNFYYLLYFVFYYYLKYWNIRSRKYLRKIYFLNKILKLLANIFYLYYFYFNYHSYFFFLYFILISNKTYPVLVCFNMRKNYTETYNAINYHFILNASLFVSTILTCRFFLVLRNDRKGGLDRSWNGRL